MSMFRELPVLPACAVEGRAGLPVHRPLQQVARAELMCNRDGGIDERRLLCGRCPMAASDSPMNEATSRTALSPHKHAIALSGVARTSPILHAQRERRLRP